MCSAIFAVCLVVLLVDNSMAVPRHHAQRLVINFQDLDDDVALDSAASSRQKRHVTSSSDDQQMEQPGLMDYFEDVHSGRSRRHVPEKQVASTGGLDSLMDLEPVGDPSSVSRKRRSAAFFLSAAIKICDQHPSLCHKVTLEDLDTKITVVISEE